MSAQLAHRAPGLRDCGCGSAKALNKTGALVGIMRCGHPVQQMWGHERNPHISHLDVGVQEQGRVGIMAAACPEEEGGAVVGQLHRLPHLLRQAGALLLAADGRLPLRQRVVREGTQACNSPPQTP